MSHTDFLPITRGGRFELHLELEVPCTDFPQVTSESIVIFDKVLHKYVPVRLEGLQVGNDLIDYLEILSKEGGSGGE